MPKAPAKDSSEILQIVTLTFAMTGGGFALLTLVLKLFLNPGATEEAKRAERNYGELIALVQQPQTRNLRINAKRGENQDLTQTLGEIVKTAGDQNGIRFPRFPQTNVAQKSGLEEHRLKITETEPTKLQNLILFAAAVQDRKRTIQVETISFKRDPKSKGTDDDQWTTQVEFVDYVTK